jgi:hypothetical protein
MNDHSATKRPRYRVYFVDREGHISRPPEVIECANDQEAAEKSRQFVDGLDIEVWDHDRLIMKYPHK